MSEDARDAAEEGEPDGEEPRLVITKGAPWAITGSRREKWSSEEFVAAQAVDVRQIGDPVLHAPAKRPKLARGDLEALAARMFASMVAARGIGIAAPQIGVPLRVCIIDVDGLGLVAVDPRIEWTSAETEETSEGCLSVRGLYGLLDRPLAARLTATDVAGKRFTVEGIDLGAQCMIHEAEHLDGILYVDRLRSRATDLHPVTDDGPVSGRTREELSPSA